MTNQYLDINGVWKKTKNIHVNVGGTWKKTKNAYVKVGGIWKKYFSGAFIFDFVIASNTTVPFNLKTAAIAAGWDQITPLIATVTVNMGVTQSSNNVAIPAFDTGTTFPASSVLNLINNGAIIGCVGVAGTYGIGGAGGKGATGVWGPLVGSGGSPGGNGGNGGVALRAQHALNVINNSSIFSGIGGNGGVGGGGGGGGGGRELNYYTGDNGGWYEYGYEGTYGGKGQGPGPAENGVPLYNQYVHAGVGGRGGDYGLAGGRGGDGWISYPPDSVGASGGAAGATGIAGTRGAYIQGNANVTWLINGTVLGSVS